MGTTLQAKNNNMSILQDYIASTPQRFFEANKAALCKAVAKAGCISGGGGGTGTVTSVSVTTANGVSGSVATGTTTPAITLSLGDITPSSIVASGTITGSNLSGTNTGDQTTISGNAATATALQTSRTINGVAFNGTSNITVTAAAGTLTGTTLASNVVSSSLTSVGTLATLTVTATITGSVSGNAATVTTNANLTGVITSSGNATSIASQTGTGTKFVVDTSPTLITPTLGVASSTSETVTGTGGNGFLELQTQSSAPSSGATNSVRLYSNGGSFAWKKQSDGFERRLISTLTADRQYSLPDTAGTIALGVPTASQTYAGTVAFSNTAPSGTTTHTYSWCQMGNVVHFRIHLKYGTAAGADNTSMTLTFPGDMPTPLQPSGFNAASDVVSILSGMGSTTTVNNTVGINSRIRRNAGDTAFEIVSTLTTTAYRSFQFMGLYFTS